jgi:hypothetical protein
MQTSGALLAVAASNLLPTKWTDISLFSGMAVLFGGVILLFFVSDRRRERLIYWSSWTIGGLLIALALLPRGSNVAIGVVAATVFAAVFYAYMRTPYIKICGKIFAFGLRDSQPDPPINGASAPRVSGQEYDPAPDSYGGMATAQKTWWLLAAVMVTCTLLVFIYIMRDEGVWYAVGGVVALILAGISFGHGDASWGYPIARGQLTQFIVTGIVTLGAFTVVYLGTYAMGKRRPLRPRRSMEYRAHPHLRKRFPE